MPLSAHCDRIAALLRRHQVVVVCGETGSGKSTQLAKLCLHCGRGTKRIIGHTQPRRIAAAAVARRVAEELAVPLGGLVGYEVRFTRRVTAQTRVKVMTDGILLAEIESDPNLHRYDTIILDEAHERTLNIDFLLGYLKRLLPRRPDLKLIITSATIDPQRFAARFDDAPVVEVSGRLHPITIHYRPPSSAAAERTRGESPWANMRHLAAVLDEAVTAMPGDVLVFLPGERDIREARRYLSRHGPAGMEWLPLYARLPPARQQAIFQPGRNRRVILATNVAETSITVPGIRCVIDSGYARLSRYSPGRKLQRLMVEPISQAAAQQRAGRCGRIAPGICYRLYDEGEFAERPPYTDPEILRTSLASVILRLKAGGMGEVEDFPFLDVPERARINDGNKLLQELQALDADGCLTDIGTRMARLPLDPRAARMVLAAVEYGCLREALIVVAGLAVPDPRIVPEERRKEAAERHLSFTDPASDFVSMVRLWDTFHAEAAQSSQSQARAFCERHLLSWVRLREWRDLYRQLSALASDIEGTAAARAQTAFDADDEDAVQNLHRALLYGLLGNVGMRVEERAYQGVRERKWRLFPGSALHSRPPKWVMAAELIETSRLYAHSVAPIRPQWIEQAGAALLTRSYFEPYWDRRRGRVMGYERVSLYGLVLRARRRVDFSTVRPREARALFIREALVAGSLAKVGRLGSKAGRLGSQAQFYDHNRKRIEEVRSLEIRNRRRDLLVSDHTLAAFYERALPPAINGTAQLEHWLQSAEADAGRALYLKTEDITTVMYERVRPQDYPLQIDTAVGAVALAYRFEPGHDEDGITATLPLPLLNQLPPALFEHLVPGLLHEKITALIKSLPKTLRRRLGPAPQITQQCLEALTAPDSSAATAATATAGLTAQLTAHITHTTGVTLRPADFDSTKLPPHLLMKFVVVDESGAEVARGDDLGVLQQRFGQRATGHFAEAIELGEATPLTRWGETELPRSVKIEQAGRSVHGYPALEDRGDAVVLRVFDTEQAALDALHHGVRRLLLLEEPLVKRLHRRFPDIEQLGMMYESLGAPQDLFDDMEATAIERAFFNTPELPRTAEMFHRFRQTGGAQLGQICVQLAATIGAILGEYKRTHKAITETKWRGRESMLSDINQQLQYLLSPGFIRNTPQQQLTHLPRYLQAIRFRLTSAGQSWERDQRNVSLITPYWQSYLQSPPPTQATPAMQSYRWLLEEWRVSLFAQQLGTAQRVSEKRIQEAWKAVSASQLSRTLAHKFN